MAPTPTGRMSRTARWLMVAAAALLATMYVAPVWTVRLAAPQYPEGLGMHIRLHTIDGVKEHDLQNINGLNHYIGMKEIVPDSIPELTYLPWIVAGLIATSLLVAAMARRPLVVVWLAAFALLGAAGLYDFWRWAYDYGHNLDVENAAIVVPGMSYQPPVIGTKQLLNFTASSWPAWGGIAAGVAFVLAATAVFLSYRRRRTPASLAALALATACATNPHIAFGVDGCAECRMLISDRRFGAVLVTSTGKAFTFDSVDCLLEYLERRPGAVVRGAWVVNAAQPGSLIPAEDAVYVQQGAVRPPMGVTVAFRSRETARETAGLTLETFDWQDVRSGTESSAH